MKWIKNKQVIAGGDPGILILGFVEEHTRWSAILVWIKITTLFKLKHI